MKLLNAIYYRLYQLQINVGYRGGSAKFGAICGMAILLILNFTAILLLLFVCFGKLFSIPQLSKIEVISLCAVLISILFFLFARKNNFEKIMNTYRSESVDDKKRGKRNGIFYILFSFLLFCTSLLLIVLKNRGDLL